MVLRFKLSENIKVLYSTLLIFFYIFSFSLPILKTSTVLSLPLSFILIASVKYTDLKSLYFSKLFVHNFSYLIVLFYVTVAFTLYHSQYDYSVSRLIPTQIIYIIIGGFVATSIFCLNDRSSDLSFYTKIIAYAFCLQTLIMFFATLSPSVLNFVRFFQPESVSIVSERYNAFRGVALSSGQFFSLAAAYGLVMVMFCIYNLKRDISYKNVFVIVLLSIGILYAGRTAFIAFIVLIPIFIASRFALSIKVFFKLFSCLVLVCILVYFLLPDLSKLIVDNVFSYAFEFIYNYIDYGTLATSSTDKLQNMYFKISYETFFLGDGRFSGVNSAYYLGTDAGYMRTILFGGIGFTLLLFFIQMSYFLKKDIFFYAAISFIALVNYKGVSMVLLLQIQCLLMLVAFFDFLCCKEEVK